MAVTRSANSDNQWTVPLRPEAEPDSPFTTYHELGFFLETWLKTTWGETTNVGDVQPLHELLKQLGLDHHRKLLAELDGMDFSMTPGSAYSQVADAFAPITITPAIYLIHTILISGRGRAEIDNVSRATTITGRRSYEIEVVRDSLIWLNFLLSLGEGSADILLGPYDRVRQAIQVRRIKWLGSPKLKYRYGAGNIQLSQDEERDLNQLWLMFEKHQSRPAQYAFDLARLKIKGSLRFGWVNFHDATDGLTSDCPNRFEFL
jgi:hypothetical protein